MASVLLSQPLSDVDSQSGENKTSRDELLPAVASSYRNVLKQIGEDPNREGLLDTSPSYIVLVILGMTPGDCWAHPISIERFGLLQDC